MLLHTFVKHISNTFSLAALFAMLLTNSGCKTAEVNPGVTAPLELDASITYVSEDQGSVRVHYEVSRPSEVLRTESTDINNNESGNGTSVIVVGKYTRIKRGKTASIRVSKNTDTVPLGNFILYLPMEDLKYGHVKVTTWIEVNRNYGPRVSELIRYDRKSGQFDIDPEPIKFGIPMPHEVNGELFIDNP